MEINRPLKNRACQRLFLLTGFTKEEKTMLVDIIMQLKGKFQDTMEFVCECTHVISAKPIRSEKFLCGCASGKWVLTPYYLRKSFSAMKWLQEEQFEWSAVTHSTFPKDIISAPRRWRHHVFKEGKAAFDDWTVFVMVENKHRRPAVYKRLIEAGGGKTISLPKSSSRDKEVIVDCVTHVIVDKCYASEVEMFANAGVPCLYPEYLAEFLFQVNPRMKPYLITDYKQKKDSQIDKIIRTYARVPKVYIGHRRLDKQMSASRETSPIPEAEGRPCATPSCSSASSLRASKRKLQLRQEIEGALEMRKRRKLVYHQPCVPPWIKSTYKTMKSKGNHLAMPFSQAQQNIVDATIEEKLLLDAMVTIESYLSTRHYPPPRLLHHIMEWILKTEDSRLAAACIKVLQSTLCMHSPALNTQMTQVYLDALLDGPREVRALHKYITTTDHWDFIHYVIRLSGYERCSSPIKRPSGSQGDQDPVEEAHNNAILLLEYLTYQIEEDFTAWKNRKEYKLPISNLGCMIRSIIWPACKRRYPSRLMTSPFKQLIKHVMRNLVKCQVPVKVGSSQFTILKHTMSLLNMTAEYCTYQTQQCTTELNLSETLITEFSLAVVSQIIDSGIHNDPAKLSLLLSLLQPQWLKLQVTQGILDRRHQSILETKEAEKLQATPLTMTKIVDYYFWMVPELKNPAPRSASSTTSRPIKKEVASFSPGKSSVKPLGDSNTDMNQFEKKDVKIQSINKRNIRGETQLHVACIRNQLDKVKLLLRVPSININAMDFAGWTPLHEAANHGHALCIKELLRFKAKSERVITDVSCKPINLVAAPSECGTTALHDAVNNNHIECARLIAEAGGEAVVSSKNKLGFTPLDMATSEEMRAALRVGSRVMADHDKENHSDLYSDVNELKQLPSQDTEQEHASTRLSEHRYVDLLGPRPSRWEVISEESCECYCMLASQLLSSYTILRELFQVRQDMTEHCDIPCISIKKESLRPIQEIGTDTMQQTSKVETVHTESNICTSKGVFIDDMELFTSLGRNLKQFVEHVERVGSWENGLTANKRCHVAVKTMKLLTL